MRCTGPRIILAIDPGLVRNGGSRFSTEHGPPPLLSTEIDIRRSAKAPANAFALAGLVDLIEQYGVTCAVVEDVSAMPRQGVSSFPVRPRHRRLRSVLPPLIRPGRISPRGLEDASGARRQGQGRRAQLALQRSAAHAALPRKKDHGRAEAALIALYGARS